MASLRFGLLLAAPWVCASEVLPKCSSGKACPHIMMVVVDDMGWNNVPWHNKDLEASMPVSLGLVREGVELDRHYTYVYCSPTRSSLLSGRLPYHVNQVNLAFNYASSGIHEKMTTLPRKLKQAGYKTHAVGKWHCGMSTRAKTPHGRGFDTHFGYFEGAEDHFTQRQCIDATCVLPNPAPPPLNMTYHSPFTDLWLTDRPAFGLNGTAYGDAMYTAFVEQTLWAHPLELPIFFYVAFQSDHQPLQAPQAYLDKFPAHWNSDRRAYAAMGAFWDASLGRIVRVLQQRGMWQNTLMVVSGDNGGPVYPSPVVGYNHCGGANNWPLLGGKSTGFEGGVRVGAFVVGGFVPPRVRGSKLEANIHITDWYTTFCHLAGVESRDELAVAAGLPDVDSVDVWPLVSGVNETSPRWEVPLAVMGVSAEGSVAGANITLLKAHREWGHAGVWAGTLPAKVSALIQGEYKLVGGKFISGFHQAPEWPSEASCCAPSCWLKPSLMKDCGRPDAPTCLFDVRADPTERENLYSTRPDVVAKMTARLHELEADVFNPQRVDKPNASAAAIMMQRYGGFVGPWQDAAPEESQVLVV